MNFILSRRQVAHSNRVVGGEYNKKDPYKGVDISEGMREGTVSRT